LLRHGVLLVFAAPSQILSLARREERGRTIPLAELRTRSGDDYFARVPTVCTAIEVNVPGRVSGRYRVGYLIQVWRM
jgi:hypothetical protein